MDPVWTPDGSRVLFVSDRSGTSDLWSVAVSGGVAQAEPTRVHRNIGRLWLRGLTDTGSYFYYASVGAVDVYQADIVAGVVKNAHTVPTTYAGSNISSVWSPDGRRLAYGSRRGILGVGRSFNVLATTDTQTGEQHEVVPALKSFLLWSWAPDGRLVLVQGSDTQGATGNYLIDVENGHTTAVTLNGPNSEERTVAGGTFMPDGRLLYFHRGKQALLARDVRTTAEDVVFDFRAEGITLPDGKYKVGPDGHTLALSARARTPDASPTTVIVKVLGTSLVRELVRAARPAEFVSFQDWTPDGQTLLFLKSSKGSNSMWPASLWSVSVHGGDPKPLGLAMDGLRDVRLNSAGTKITFTAGWPLNELWVMENFLPE
jgi:Tol biopolymer transport system component